jgi:hypothetical protein
VYPGLLSTWARYDRDAAVDFLDRVPRGAERDAAITGLFMNQIEDIGLAESLYGRIAGAQARRVAAQQLYRALAAGEPARAQRYRQAAGISESPNPNNLP